MTTTAVHVQCVHKLRVCIATSRKQHFCMCRTTCERWPVLRNNRAGFCKAQHTSNKCPQRLFDAARHCDVDPVWRAVLSAKSANKRNFNETSCVTLTSRCACAYTRQTLIRNMCMFTSCLYYFSSFLVDVLWRCSILFVNTTFSSNERDACPAFPPSLPAPSPLPPPHTDARTRTRTPFLLLLPSRGKTDTTRK